MHKKEFKSLIREEESFSNLVSALPDAVIVTSLDGIITSFFDGREAPFGKNASHEVLGTNIFNWIDKEFHDKAKINVELLLNGNPRTDNEYILYRPKGESFWASAHASVMKNTDGNAEFIIFVVRDITVIKQAEQALVTSFESIQTALNGTVHALAKAAEMRDPYTSGHQHRVSIIACAIAEELGLDSEFIKGLKIAALLHDIGKIALPMDILSKPGKLSRIEFELIKTHVSISHEILKEIEFPWPVAKAVAQHHERIDGSGYDSSALGDEIILEARILGVADVVEAMATHRPYRPARGLETALKEIEDYKGIHYDSSVVDACIKIFNEKKVTL